MELETPERIVRNALKLLRFRKKVYLEFVKVSPTRNSMKEPCVEVVLK